jgi:3'-phosphoadenosine 5'-phosphosulfate (PAPS) 3'-phosphatase
MLPHHHAYSRELEVAIPLIRDVSAKVRDIYDNREAETHVKSDGSPVTDADLLAERLIRETLSSSFPEDGLLTEETHDDGERLQKRRCWIADPIDGTAQFVNRSGNFDIMLALVVDGRPVLSVCAHPPSQTMTIAILGHGSWLISEDGASHRVEIEQPPEPPRLVGSVYYGPEHRDAHDTVAKALDADPVEILPVGFQPRAFLPSWRSYDAFIGFWKANGDSPAREWDLAASDIFINEAGGRFTDLYGSPYQYNQPDPRPSAGLLACASSDLHHRIVELLAPILPPSPPKPPPIDQE